jgi:hypothetical protein
LESPDDGAKGCQKGNASPSAFSDASSDFGVDDEDQKEDASPASYTDESIDFGIDMDHEDAALRTRFRWADEINDSNSDDSQVRSSSKASSGSNHQSNHKLAWEPVMRYPYDFAKVIKKTMNVLRKSELIANAEKSQSSHECLLTIRLSAQGALQKDQALAVVQKAMLYTADACKSMYIIGFRSPSAFIPTVSGFDVKYGAMGNAKAACWQIFKKGFCRHGDTCCKEHPVWEMPVRVLIEAAPCQPQMTWTGCELRNEM